LHDGRPHAAPLDDIARCRRFLVRAGLVWTAPGGAIEAKFNNETGNIPLRADFPNPNGLLRHGQHLDPPDVV
jgi:hypothetical protein